MTIITIIPVPKVAKKREYTPRKPKPTVTSGDRSTARPLAATSDLAVHEALCRPRELEA